jgi:hypothetical protein
MLKTLALRQQFITDLAADEGLLIPVSRPEADSWRLEWHRVLRAVARAHSLQCPRPVAPPKHKRKSRSTVLPQAMTVPGTWLMFRPRMGHPTPPHLYRVVMVVPPDVALADVLDATQLALLERHVDLHATPRYLRVLVAQTGSRKSCGCLRSIVAGELAKRAEVMSGPPQVQETGRLSQPLAPGTQVSWRWHSPFGVMVQSGVVVAYLPADVPIHRVCPGFRCTWGVRPISGSDRYLVRSTSGKKPHMTPAAHMVEQEWLGLNSNNRKPCPLLAVSNG